jgi:4-amino-4-deoxy-L-arabinose transferase
VSAKTPRIGSGVAVLLALAALQLLPGLGSAPLERAEVYFLDGARAMVERGDYLVPHYRGEPFFDKPALTYWLLASAFHAYGFTLEAARLVPVLATLLVLLATVWLGTLLLDRRSALAGGLILATTPVFIAFGRVAMSDMLLTLWSTLAVALAVVAYRAGSSTWAVPVLGATLGLGFLTKGPVAVLLPGLGILLLLVRRRRRAFPATPGALAQAVLLFALTGLGWFAMVYLRLGTEPLEHFFLRENLERFAGQSYDAGRPFWYYLTTYLGEGAPWSLFLPLALARDPLRPAVSRAQRGVRFLALWLGLMLVPLSLSRGKIDYYLLPLYPPVSLLLGRFFTRAWQGLERGWATLVLGMLTVALALGALLPFPLPGPWLPGPYARFALTLAAVLAGLLTLMTALRPTPRRVLLVLAGVSALLFVVAAGWLLPAFRAGQPNATIVEDVTRELRYVPEATVVLCTDGARVERDLLFFARASVEPRCEVYRHAGSSRPYLLLVDGRQHRSLSRVEGMREVRVYHYLPADALTLRGFLGFADLKTLTLMANFPTDDPVAERKRKRARKRALRRLDALKLPHPAPE